MATKPPTSYPMKNTNIVYPGVFPNGLWNYVSCTRKFKKRQTTHQFLVSESDNTRAFRNTAETHLPSQISFYHIVACVIHCIDMI